MRNPYDVLGVSKTADAKEIKSAYRKLAKRYHPDQNKGADAKAKFEEANQAHEILGNAEKRAQYDRGEIDEEGKEKFAGFEGFGGAGGFGGMGRGTGADGFETFTRGFRGGRSAAGGGGAEDILSQMFGGAMGGMGGGGTGGRGADPFAGMGGMGGQRQQAREVPKGKDRKITLTVSLRELAEGAAPVTINGKRVSVKIPPEATPGTVVRLKGKGEESAGGAGDALITIEMAEHSQFQRFGADLRTHVAVPFSTAVLGGKVRVPTLTGAVNLSVPEWTRAGRSMRIPGKGLPKRDGTRGDIFVQLAVDLPDARDERLVEAAKALAEREAA